LSAAVEDLARGELAEETGLRAGRLEHLGTLYFAYGVSDQSFDVWRATGLVEGEQALEETEHGLRVGRFRVAEFEEMVASGVVQDAATVAAWHLATR
jgi:8-oxo-dGTP pyrophosphatase MutT (NUDIX family)